MSRKFLGCVGLALLLLSSCVQPPQDGSNRSSVSAAMTVNQPGAAQVRFGGD